ncbi:helix-turn-helix domain-containing protein [Nonomuraea bangladeshensis]|uniref:helix-turn-helix domain-containing protein n=1 Tax=Nonomuraea bangladeshensis TaxID=404385 RepID=UPI0031D9187C
MEGDDVQVIVDALAARLGRSVAVDDPSIHLIAASRHFGDEDAARVRSVLDREVSREIRDWLAVQGVADWTRPARLPGYPRLGIEPRVCVPVRCEGMLLGFLWLIDGPHRLDDDEIGMAEEAAASVGVILYRRMLLHERERSRAASLLRLLISPEADDRRQAVEELREEQILTAGDHLIVLVAEVEGESGDPSLALETAAEHVQRLRPPGSVLMLAQRRRAVVVLTSGHSMTEQTARDLADRLRSRFAELAGRDRTAEGTRCLVGISRSRQGLDTAVEAHREAVTAARAARLLPVFGEVATWSALGPFAMLLRIDIDQLAKQLPLPGIGDLLADPANDVLVTSAERFLDRAGDVAAAAEALHVHRTTLYYRLKRIETITGLSMDDGMDRLTLHLAIKLARLNEGNRSAGGSS